MKTVKRERSERRAASRAPKHAPPEARPRPAAPRPGPPAIPKPRGGGIERAIILGLVLGLAALLAWREETSLDLGFHLATGRTILDHHTWPRVDEFTYTVAGRPYVDMHGLFQVAIALAERAGGFAGIGLFRVAMIVLATGFVWAAARRRGVDSPILLAAGFVLGLAAWELRFFARPELASYLALAIMLYGLRRHWESGDWRWLAAMVPLQLVWVYSHALSSIGIAVLGLYALASLRRPSRPAWAPWLALAAAAAVMFLNPYGATGIEFLWHLRTRLSEENPFAQTISELSSPWSAEARAFWPVRAFVVLLAGGAAAVLLSIRRLPLFDTLLFALFGALALSAIRNIGLFVVAALPVALAAATAMRGDAKRRRAGGSPRASRIGFGIAVLGILVFGELVWAGGWYAANRRPERFGCGPSPATYPLDTVRYLREHALRGPIYNHLNFGGYLIGELWPQERVFADGRLEVMGEDFFKRYLDINAGPGWAAMMTRYDPNIALIPITSPQQMNRLAKDPAWQMAAMDGVAVLFLRARPENSALIAEAQARFAALRAAGEASPTYLPPPLPPWPVRLFGPRPFPWTAWGRGNGLYALHEYAAAQEEFRRGLERTRQGEVPLAINYAAAAFHRGRSLEAVAWYRRVLELDSDNPLARERLGKLASGAPAGFGK
jgi:hypothetical protein